MRRPNTQGCLFETLSFHPASTHPLLAFTTSPHHHIDHRYFSQKSFPGSHCVSHTQHCLFHLFAIKAYLLLQSKRIKWRATMQKKNKSNRTASLLLVNLKSFAHTKTIPTIHYQTIGRKEAVLLFL